MFGRLTHWSCLLQSETQKKLEEIKRLRETMKDAAEEGRGKDDLQKQLVSADFHFCLSILFVSLSGHLCVNACWSWNISWELTVHSFPIKSVVVCWQPFWLVDSKRVHCSVALSSYLCLEYFSPPPPKTTKTIECWRVDLGCVGGWPEWVPLSPGGRIREDGEGREPFGLHSSHHGNYRQHQETERGNQQGGRARGVTCRHHRRITKSATACATCASKRASALDMLDKARERVTNNRVRCHERSWDCETRRHETACVPWFSKSRARDVFLHVFSHSKLTRVMSSRRSWSTQKMCRRRSTSCQGSWAGFSQWQTSSSSGFVLAFVRFHVCLMPRGPWHFLTENYGRNLLGQRFLRAHSRPVQCWRICRTM